MEKLKSHPMQPSEIDVNGTVRFKENKIVDFLLENGSLDMNSLMMLDFSIEDREQFAQLIGYSLNGYSELSYVRDTTYEVAVRMHETKETEQEARIHILEAKLKVVCEGLKRIVPEVFSITSDDLEEGV